MCLVFFRHKILCSQFIFNFCTANIVSLKMGEAKVRKITKFFSKIQTIHGLSYIGDHKSSKITRIFWITAIILSFLWCFFFFTQVYRKVFIEPDISISITYKPLSGFPFPAVTICPHNKVSNSACDKGQDQF